MRFTHVAGNCFTLGIYRRPWRMARNWSREKGGVSCGGSGVYGIRRGALRGVCPGVIAQQLQGGLGKSLVQKGLGRTRKGAVFVVGGDFLAPLTNVPPGLMTERPVRKRSRPKTYRLPWRSFSGPRGA